MVLSRDYNLPTREECYALLKEYEIPDNIMNHIDIVNKISIFLANKLIETGMEINIDMVDRASLLHDLDKMLTLGKHNHGEITKEILTKKGYPELAEIALQHRVKSINDNLSWEAKIVSYADRRVMHNKIVSISQRFADLIARYNVPEGRLDSAEKQYNKLEKEIFDRIGMKPKELKKHIN